MVSEVGLDIKTREWWGLRQTGEAVPGLKGTPLLHQVVAL